MIGLISAKSGKHLRYFLYPGRMAVLFIVASVLWIVASDLLIGKFSGDPAFYRNISIGKGLFYVFLSASTLFLFIRHVNRELYASREIYHAAFNASPDAICISRLCDGAIMEINETFTTITGYSEADAIGNTIVDLGLLQNPSSLPGLEHALRGGGAIREVLTTFRLKSGALIKGALSACTVTVDRELCVVSIVRDLSRELEAREEIEKLVNYDPDTGLPNHNLLMDRLNQVIRLGNREFRTTVLIYISLTGFKRVVDVLGHSGGGEVLRAISERIVSAVRQYDTVARIHGDQFVVMLGGMTKDSDLNFILKKMEKMFAMPLSVQGAEFAMPACMGVACFPTDGLTAEIIIQNAHIAMNQARLTGASFRYYSESMNKMAMERYATETGMLHAISDEEFFLCYQPKVAINGTDVTGMEALVRWRRPGVGVVPPDKFIPVAEENGMILSLGAWVLQEACRQNKAWQDAGLPRICVSVNISARQLRENSFVDLVLDTLNSTGLAPCYLDLELTESAVMADSEDTVQKLIRLKQIGVGISVDDFGTGYSSLSYLKHLPIDTIKVDRSFVQDIVSDPDNAAIVKAIIAIARALKLKVVAEGVETIEQLEFLQKGKCHEVQGYYFSKPLEADLFEAFLTNAVSSLDLSVPSPSIISRTTDVDYRTTALPCPDNNPPVAMNSSAAGTAESIGAICLPTTPARPSDNLAIVLKRFQTEKELLVLPVVDVGRVVGILNRATFLEEHVIGMHGFAFQINHSRKMRDLMNPVELLLEADTPIKDAARVIQEKGDDIRIDNVCVTRNGSYEGILDVHRFIHAITEINLTLAKGANPLTGLPGNESIQREINERLKTSQAFAIAYIDIDNFKPYNDYYGFQQGDVVIKVLAEIVTTSTRSGKSGFCGHIGGDDFIVITDTLLAMSVASNIIRDFEMHRPILHGEQDFSAGCYTAINRKGEPETFQLLSLSIGIVNTRLTPVGSYAQLASLSTEVKKMAKKQEGSAVIVNRRTDLQHGSHTISLAEAA